MNDDLYHEVEVELGKLDAMTLVLHLDEGRIPSLAGYYEVLFDDNRPVEDRTRLMLYFPYSETLPSASVSIFMQAIGITDFTIKETPLKREDYLEAYKKYYRSFSVTDKLVIVPSWEKGSKDHISDSNKDKIPLYLDPGLAFGTGQHATTKLCLQYLSEFVTPGLRIIDAGAGSGILSIAAILLGAESVLAFDVDINSKEAVSYNADLNAGVKEKLKFVHGGFDIEEFKTFHADILVANVTKNIILSNTNYIKQGNYPRLVFSGILVEHKDEIEAHFSDHWKPTICREDDGWIVLELIRK